MLERSFIIVASDGIWDHLDNQTAVKVVGAALARHHGITGVVAAHACEAVLAKVNETIASHRSELPEAVDGDKTTGRRKSLRHLDDMSIAVVIYRDPKVFKTR